MSTAADVINEAKGLTRTSQSVPDATFLLWLSRNNRKYCRMANWPELRFLNATLTTVANQAAYDLPISSGSAFSRFMGKWVLYDPVAVTNGYQGGTQLPILNQGCEQDDSRIIGYTNLGSGTPSACYVRAKSGTPSTKQLVLAPFPADANKTIVYSYYADPAAFSAMSDSLTVEALYGVLVNSVCREIAAYTEDADLAAYYGREEMNEWKTAKQTLGSL